MEPTQQSFSHLLQRHIGIGVPQYRFREIAQSRAPSSHAHYYPLFGRRFQHQPVSVYPDGRERPHLHRGWRDEPRAWWWEFDAVEQPVDPARLASNLQEAGIDYVLVTRRPGERFGRSMRWSQPLSRLGRALPPERRLFANEHAEIWDLRSDP